MIKLLSASGIWKCQETLKEGKEKLAFKAEAERESQDLLNHAKTVKGKVVAELRQLRQLMVQEETLLAQMEEVEKEILAKREECLAKLSEEDSSLEGLHGDLEEKCQLPSSELLQCLGSILQRCETEVMAKNIMGFVPSLKWKIWDFDELSSFLEGIRDMLLSGLQLQRENVTLDPDTVNPWLVLSEDCQSVKVGEEAQCLPRTPERFDPCFYVLGREGFATGRHGWDVSVGREEAWCLGVSKRSVRRKEEVECGPEAGIWCIGNWGGGYCASDPPAYPPLVLKEEPKSIRVSLNCEGRRVAFCDANTSALLHLYSRASFSGEVLLPSFYMDDKAHLIISPKDN